MQIRGSVVLVTGANRGIGAAFVQAFRAAGAARIYAASRSGDSVETEGVVPLKLDVTNADDIREAAAACTDVSIVVNNAGVHVSAAALAADAGQAFLSQIDVNVLGPVRITRAFAPILKSNNGGAVVTVHSVLSWLTVPGRAPYSASKAASWAFTNGIRAELAEQKTQVVGVHVGYVDTDMTADVNAPKASALDVAMQVVEGIEAGAVEVLADGTARAVKASLSSPHPAYLFPPASP